MGRAEPFVGYSWILRTIIWVLVPAFAAWQFARLRRAFHVFQLEAYKRPWFRSWVAAQPGRRWFLHPFKDAKKPLVMTGRAWRTVVTGTLLTVFGILIPSGVVHVSFGTPYDLLTCALMFSLMLYGLPELLLVSDALMKPVQSAINGRFLRAAQRRLRLIDPVVVGVTGSYGKTSTKFAVARVLGDGGDVLASPASFNTTLGVARTINEELNDGHRVLVVEMGARREGDIAEICDVVHPKIGVLTAIGPAHLETFGSLDAVRRTKFELIRALPADGVAVVNVDDDEVRTLVDGGAVPEGVATIRYGLDPGGKPGVTAKGLRQLPRGTAFTIVSGAEEVDVETRLLGRHAIGHVLAGVAVARALGKPLASLGPGIAGMTPAEHRLQIIDGAGGVVVIDDAYNSNPQGAAEALEVLRAMPGGKRIVISPGMVELGPEQHRANVEFGRHAAEVADVFIAVAPLNRAALLEGAAAADGIGETIAVGSLAEATARLAGLVSAGDVVLFENDLPDQYEESSRQG
jgi:UDP-N-acetylmuramoyl-tripeptide--D-alanyl-D-alanine ligase